MQEFFTWTMLGTYAGAVLATTLVTQLFKGVTLIEQIPTRIFSYIVALVLLLAAQFFTGSWTVPEAALCLLNAVIVSLAANGSFEAAAQVHASLKEPD